MLPAETETGPSPPTPMATMAKPGGGALSLSPFHSHTHLKDLPLFDFSARPNFTHSHFSHHLNVTVKHSRKPSILPIIRAQTQTQTSPGTTLSPIFLR